MSVPKLGSMPPTRAEVQASASTRNLIANAPHKRRDGRRWLLTVVGCAAVLALAAWASDRWGTNGTETLANYHTHEVGSGPLEIRVVEQGNLESTNNVDVRCEVEGGRIGSGGGGGGSSGPGTQIIWIYKEGEYVSKGDKVIELDPTGLKQQEIEQQIAYESARQLLITAENTFDAAKIAVDEYALGTFPKELELVEAEITVAKENMRRAEEYAKYSQRLYDKGFQTQLLLEADLFAVENARLTLKAAETKKSALVEFTSKKMSADLHSLRDSAEASLKAAKAKFNLEEHKLKQIREQLDKCTIYAPRDGMIIYASERDRRGRSDSVEIKEGAVVRLRQVIVQLPDLQHMQVKAKVHESVIERVKKGQRVNIRIDAVPNVVLHGSVQSINNQPEAGSWYSSNVKEYGVYVSIDETLDNLKPGMTAEVEILIDRLDDVLTVPVQAVVQKGEESFCYVMSGGQVEQRPIVLGDTNDVLIEIKDGLVAGDLVVLNPRSVIPEARDQSGQIEPKNGMGVGGRLKKQKNEPAARDVPDDAPPAEANPKGKGKRPRRENTEPPPLP
jgi:RND family efflux transporter MFP subunit